MRSLPPAFAEDVQRHVDGHGLVSRDGQEVSMDGIVRYRVELKLVKDSQIVLAIDVEVHDVTVGSVGESLEVSCIYREENVLHSVAVEVAGYLTLSADALGERLAALGSCGAEIAGYLTLSADALGERLTALSPGRTM